MSGQRLVEVTFTFVLADATDDQVHNVVADMAVQAEEPILDRHDGGTETRGTVIGEVRSRVEIEGLLA